MIDIIISILIAIVSCLTVYHFYQLLRENRRRASEEALVGLEYMLFRLELADDPFLNRGEGMYG